MKEKTILEFKVEERVYQFICDEDSPIGQVFDALVAMKAHVLEIMKNEQSEKVINE